MRTSFHLQADPPYGYLLLGQEGNKCVEWGIVAVVTTAFIAGPTPCPQHLVDTSAAKMYCNIMAVQHMDEGDLGHRNVIV